MFSKQKWWQKLEVVANGQGSDARNTLDASSRCGDKTKNAYKIGDSVPFNKSVIPENCKLDTSNIPASLLVGGVRPTIADLVKVRERRKSFERDTSSGSEWEKRRLVDRDTRVKRRTQDLRRQTKKSQEPKLRRLVSRSSVDSCSSKGHQAREAEELSCDSADSSFTLDDDAEPGGHSSGVDTALLASSNPVVYLSSSFAAAQNPPLPLSSALTLPSPLTLSSPSSYLIKQKMMTATKMTQDRTSYSAITQNESPSCRNVNKPQNVHSKTANNFRSTENLSSSEILLGRHSERSENSRPMEEPRGCKSSTCEDECCLRVDSSSDSDESSLSDEPGVRVDLDSEQTQTFALSADALSQGRIGSKISALKMSKFGSSGLRDVGSAAHLPTRCDLPHAAPTLSPNHIPHRGSEPLASGSSGAEEAGSGSNDSNKSSRSSNDGNKCSSCSKCNNSNNHGSGCNQAKNNGYDCCGKQVGKCSSSSSCSRSTAKCSSCSRSAAKCSSCSCAARKPATQCQWPGKVKTAAERKTYADLPAAKATHAAHKTGVVIKSECVGVTCGGTVPCTAACADVAGAKPGAGCGNAGAPAGSACGAGGAPAGSACGAGGAPGGAGCEDEEDDEQLSQLARHLSQMSEGQLGQAGLQELDQEDLAALLPDITTAPAEDPSAAQVFQTDGSVPPARPSKSSSERPRDDAGDEKEDEEPMDVDPKSLDERRRKTKNSKCSQEESAGDSAPSHLEPYAPLDCSVSNVSPDSGIQSVNGSPLHQVIASPHHLSPLYPINSRTLHADTAILPGASRPYSPSNQYSPPPPVLLPAVTPPHLVSSPSCSPRYLEDGNPVSPEMPTLKCQVDPPPPWVLDQQRRPVVDPKTSSDLQASDDQVLTPNEGQLKKRPAELIDGELSMSDSGHHTNAKQSVSDRPDYEHSSATAGLEISEDITAACPEEKGDRGPGRPSDILTKKRPRGRPRSLKSKRAQAMQHSVEESLLGADKAPGPISDSCSLLPLGLDSTTLSDVPGRRTSSKHGRKNYDDGDLDADTRTNISGVPTDGRMNDVSYNTRVRTPAPDAQPKDSHLSHENVNPAGNDGTKIKRGVGRPRKHPRPQDTDASISVPPPHALNKKIFSDQIAHKIINEKVRNSEKSDKLSVHGTVLDGGGTPRDDRASDAPSETSVRCRSRNDSPNIRTNSPSTSEHQPRSRGRRGARTEGIPLEERKKKRGRKKELPAIFRKVYGSLADDSNSWNKRDKIVTTVACSSSVGMTNCAPASDTLNLAAASHLICKKKKKHHTQFKSKHRNIVDPVFLASLEELLLELEKCTITKGGVKPPVGACGNVDAPLPAIFRVKKGIFSAMGGKKRRATDKRTSDRESGTEADAKEKITGKRKKKLQEAPKQERWPSVLGRDRSEANEQRLPLKKRHRHISTAVPSDVTPSFSSTPHTAANSPGCLVNISTDHHSHISSHSPGSANNTKNFADVNNPCPHIDANHLCAVIKDVDEALPITRGPSHFTEEISENNSSTYRDFSSPYIVRSAVQQNNNNDTNKNLQLAASELSKDLTHTSFCGDCPPAPQDFDDAHKVPCDAKLVVGLKPINVTSTYSSEHCSETNRNSAEQLPIRVETPSTSVPYDTSDHDAVNSSMSSCSVNARKPEILTQSLSTTTPKKRHRLEAEMRISSISAQEGAAIDGCSPAALPLLDEVPAVEACPESQPSGKGKSSLPPSSPTKTRSSRGRDSPKDYGELVRVKLPRMAKASNEGSPVNRTSSPTKLPCDRVTTRLSKSPSVSPTASPVKRRCESRASTVSTRSRYDTPSKPGTPDLIADTNVSPESIAQDIIITDGILESAKRQIDLLECKVDLSPLELPIQQNLTIPINSSSMKEINSVVTNEGTHSDSDIASEHEPLRESDQSGFMSDKEEPNEALKERSSPPQKRLKKKRELRSPKQLALRESIVQSLPEIDEDEKDVPSLPFKKKHIKRKPNRTGFPTVKRKKKPRAVTDDEEMDSAADAETLLPLTQPMEVEDGFKRQIPIEEKSLVSVVPEVSKQRMRGRPKKMRPAVTSFEHDGSLKSHESESDILDRLSPARTSPLCNSQSNDEETKYTKTETSKAEILDALPNSCPNDPADEDELPDILHSSENISPGFPTVGDHRLHRDYTGRSSSLQKDSKLNDEKNLPTTEANDVSTPDLSLLPETKTEETILASDKKDLVEAGGMNTSGIIRSGGGAVVSRGWCAGPLLLGGARTRRKRELILEELSNPTLKRRRKLLPPQRDHRSIVPLESSELHTASPCLPDPLLAEFAGDGAPAEMTEGDGSGTSTDAGTGGGTVSSEPASCDESTRPSHAKRRIPRWRKKYLVAGLFSDYYKQDEPPPRRNGDVLAMVRNHKSAMLATSLIERPASQSPLLPPPCYCRKWLRERLIDFKLPYDLWFLHTYNFLPGRDLVPSWNYKKVKSNIFYDVKPSPCAAESQPCNCRRPQDAAALGCGDDCINRMMFIECSPQTCPIGDRCSNQRIQRHQSLSCLMRFMTPNKGWGIKVTQPIKTGTIILEYVGEVVSEKEFKLRMQTTYANDTHHYCLNLDRGLVIDGHRMGGDCRFVNHSCEPNCEMQKWGVNGQYRMALYALQDIPSSTLACMPH
ncbi:uncharacterized protein LOC108666567 [Hyalella azteca]|uniref:Uncharacterized protein LOC108666567 n=1 Tax=Hyalella azteca TaxID=294128 RepID=A0A979FR91_HYAAZ|nr:uncharacterized protein LOC108666567 [Hyalella azteca]